MGFFLKPPTYTPIASGAFKIGDTTGVSTAAASSWQGNTLEFNASQTSSVYTTDGNVSPLSLVLNFIIKF